jgi:hypothetical protein
MCAALADGTSNESSDNPDGLESPGNSYLKAGVDHTNNEDDDSVKELLCATQSSKRPLDNELEESMVLPKMKKNSNSTRQHAKASDFDEISKEILAPATSIFRCLIVTQAPFPDGTAETKLAKEAWHEACEIKGVHVKLTPPVVRMVSPPFLVHGWSD